MACCGICPRLPMPLGGHAADFLVGLRGTLGPFLPISSCGYRSAGLPPLGSSSLATLTLSFGLFGPRDGQDITLGLVSGSFLGSLFILPTPWKRLLHLTLMSCLFPAGTLRNTVSGQVGRE